MHRRSGSSRAGSARGRGGPTAAARRDAAGPRPRSSARRRTIRRRRAAALAVALCALATLVIAVSSGGGGVPAPHAARGEVLAASDPASSPARPPGSSASLRPHPRHRAPDPGSLPQTDQLPSATTAQFRGLMGDLWAGVTSNSVARALPAFFPLHAYEQLKAIGSPEEDWRDRLVGDYRLDLAAAHELPGAAASGARLIAVHVVPSYAHWVPPGACYNSVGYYELPNARVLYSAGGAVRSFGIASMISWRGVWYVVHLGAVLRSGEGGVVDEPSSGAGESADSGTC